MTARRVSLALAAELWPLAVGLAVGGWLWWVSERRWAMTLENVRGGHAESALDNYRPLRNDDR